MKPAKTPGWLIGELATNAGVHVETIRYYQRIDILQTPRRPLGGARRYGEQDAERLRFVRRAQDLGFTLDEVRQMLLLEDGESCDQTRELASRKLASVNARLADLRRMKRVLEELLRACAAGDRPRSCPIIESLSK
ncbi:MAG: Hg(II)-responsive transcriptional regulator [Betaproteobacteria bacterium]|nr:Hg(II)-responsive transcriptional regulator [Betaproteobacteria bacterium]